MTKHRTISGFVAIALLTIAATAASIRTHGPLTDGIVVSSGTTTKGLTVDANTPTASFDERWSAIAASKTDTPEQ
jgi:hypothetical protein